MKRIFGLLMTGLFFLSYNLHAQKNGQLVVFIQDGRSISQDFKRNSLSEIKKIAKANNLKLEMVDASEGAPIEVEFTPAIFYKKDNQNVLFQGRYNDLKNLTVFAKSNGQSQPSKAKRVGDENLTWTVGRATMKTTIKIHPLEGKPLRARKFDMEKYESNAIAAVVNGMAHFRSAAANDLAKNYHMEFFPEVNRKEGFMLVHMKLYSDFDMNKPIFETTVPSGSQWDNWEEAFRKAGDRCERALIAQISNWDNGDGFDTLKKSTPIETWTSALSHPYEEKTSLSTKGIARFVSEK